MDPTIDRLMINVVPVSLGLLLGLAGTLVGSRIFPLLIGDPKRAGIQALSSRLQAGLHHALQKVSFDSTLWGTALARTVTGYLRQVSEWLARLQRYNESARRPLTGALLLGIAGGLLGTFVVVS